MIYFIRSTISGAVKIGYTGNDPAARLSALQTGCPEPLELLGSIEGGIDLERRLHSRFALYRLRPGGEWFRGEPAVMAEVQAILFPPLPAPSPPLALELTHEGEVVCPCCGMECTRIAKHENIAGGDKYEAGWGGRGDLLVVTFVAECGSSWDLCFGFHKGSTTAFVRLIRDCREIDEFTAGGAFDEGSLIDTEGVPTF